MVVQSLGRRTDLIFLKFSGEVADKGTYTLIQTPKNPTFHWGNFIIFDHPPRMGSLKEWTSIFDREFEFYAEPHHYTFTWDTRQTDKGDCQEFLDANFEFDSAAVLLATQLNPPPKMNDRIEVRKITSDENWSDVVNLQNLCADPRFMSETYLQFKQRQMDTYRQMSEAGMGSWFGAYLKDQLVADLGIFHEDGIGRYQNVGTHPEFRRQGICGTLVYLAGLLAFEEFGVEHLVMEADIDYHAAGIYESVGFERKEVNHSLSWWKGKESNG